MVATDNNEPSDEKILELANQISTLLQFASLLVPDIDILERVTRESGEISSRTLTLAPVLGAVGEDYEEKHLEAEVRRKRSIAILNLAKVIRDTEKEREDFKLKQANKAKVRAELGGILGL